MNVKITGETVLEIQIIMSILFRLKKLEKINKKFCFVIASTELLRKLCVHFLQFFFFLFRCSWSVFI